MFPSPSYTRLDLSFAKPTVAVYLQSKVWPDSSNSNNGGALSVGSSSAADPSYELAIQARCATCSANTTTTVSNTKGYSSTYLAMGFANVRVGTQKRRGVFGYPPEH